MTGTTTARAHTASARGPIVVTATITPGPDSFTLAGAHPYDTSRHSRIGGGLTRSGLGLPAGEVDVRIDKHWNLTESLDLAVACAILAAGGRIDREALDRVTLLGGMGWSGHLDDVMGIADLAHTASKGDRRTVLLPATQSLRVHRLDFGLDVVGVRSVREAADFLNRQANQA
ncbi:magnesium chelatase domain-containing protein [Streptomyces cinereoruber]|uniref:magnesium chelatase domain-containing protein n=1 Tax=Streptomyces cinereoruber TaxID=67260 RepID=UPI0036265FBB